MNADLDSNQGSGKVPLRELHTEKLKGSVLQFSIQSSPLCKHFALTHQFRTFSGLCLIAFNSVAIQANMSALYYGRQHLLLHDKWQWQPWLHERKQKIVQSWIPLQWLLFCLLRIHDGGANLEPLTQPHRLHFKCTLTYMHCNCLIATLIFTLLYLLVIE